MPARMRRLAEMRSPAWMRRLTEMAVTERLIEVAEARGVDHRRGVVLFALDEALAPLDRGARLWAQTERLRACARAAAEIGDGAQGESEMWDAALEAVGR